MSTKMSIMTRVVSISKRGYRIVELSCGHVKETTIQGVKKYMGKRTTCMTCTKLAEMSPVARMRVGIIDATKLLLDTDTNPAGGVLVPYILTGRGWGVWSRSLSVNKAALGAHIAKLAKANYVGFNQAGLWFNRA